MISYYLTMWVKHMQAAAQATVAIDVDGDGAADYLVDQLHIHSLSPVRVVMMKSKELKTKIYSHADSLTLSLLL